jgi:phosphopantetheinyl transferase
MPLFYQHNINEHAKLAVWHITEPEVFFLDKIPLQKAIRHPHKRLQHLAGRYLLKILDPDFPLNFIAISQSNKPYLHGDAFHFSISHCGDYAAAIISTNKWAGIDVELVNPKIEQLQYKFLTETEIALLNNKSITINTIDLAGSIKITNTLTNLLTLCWSSKEAIYKWYGKGGLDFKKHLHIKHITVTDTRGHVTCAFTKNASRDLTVHFNYFNGLFLTWLVE